jgi:plastocyanin
MFILGYLIFIFIYVRVFSDFTVKTKEYIVIRRSLRIGLIVFSFWLAGCGGGGPSTSINVIMTDFHYTPDSFTVPAGQEISIKATNNGAVVHDFAIMKHGMEVTKDFTEEDRKNVYWIIEVLPGDQTSTTFTAPSEPGEYQIVCGTPGHFISGMIGKLTVVAP